MAAAYSRLTALELEKLKLHPMHSPCGVTPILPAPMLPIHVPEAVVPGIGCDDVPRSHSKIPAPCMHAAALRASGILPQPQQAGGLNGLPEQA